MVGVTSGAAVRVATVTPMVTTSTAGLPANTTIAINVVGFDPIAANNFFTLPIFIGPRFSSEQKGRPVAPPDTDQCRPFHAIVLATVQTRRPRSPLE